MGEHQTETHVTRDTVGGKLELEDILHTIIPTLQPEAYFFYDVPADHIRMAKIKHFVAEALDDPSEIFMLIREPHKRDHMTLILNEARSIRFLEDVDLRDVSVSSPYHMITLNVHSSLESVGLMAAVSQRLAKAEIPCNPVSGFFSDHLFVLDEWEDEAMIELYKMKVEGQQTE